MAWTASQIGIDHARAPGRLDHRESVHLALDHHVAAVEAGGAGPPRRPSRTEREVARGGRGTGQHQIAHARKAVHGLVPAAKRFGQAAHFLEPAGDQRGAGVFSAKPAPVIIPQAMAITFFTAPPTFTLPRAFVQLRIAIRTPVLKSFNGESETKFTLNSLQQKALDEISVNLGKNIFTPILMHGVTGSGKTEIYLNAIARVLENDGSAIYLVPEIALTPQLISRIQWRFDQEQIAIMHSGIAEAIRYDQWRQIKRGQIKLVIGARSALFAPLPNLQLIIVDEEHDASYKQDDRLCYHGRDLAVLKAKLDQAVVVLGSATPGIRSYFNARNKKYHYLEITAAGGKQAAARN